MWHKAIWKRHPMRLELTRVGLLVELANHYTTRGALTRRYIGMISIPYLPRLHTANIGAISIHNLPRLHTTNTDAMSIPYLPRLHTANIGAISIHNLPRLHTTNTDAISIPYLPRLHTANIGAISIHNLPGLHTTNIDAIFLPHLPRLHTANIDAISIPNLPRLHTTNVNRSNEIKWFGTKKEAKKQIIFRRNNHEYRLHRWSSTSHKYTYASRMSAVQLGTGSKKQWPLHECI